MGSGTFASAHNNDEIKCHLKNQDNMSMVNCTTESGRRDSGISSSGNYASPMSFMAHSSVSSANQSKENFEGFFAELRDQRNTDYDKDDSTQSSNFTFQSKGSIGGSGGGAVCGSANGRKMTRSRTRHIFSSHEKFQSHPDLKDLYEKEEEAKEIEFKQQEIQVQLGDVKVFPTHSFGTDVRAWTNSNPDEPIFDSRFRSFISTHIDKARKKREENYNEIIEKIGAKLWNNPSSVASNSYVPYPALRQERFFLYDVDTYPLHQHLADILGVDDLSLIHQHSIKDKKTLMKPLLDSRKRQTFHRCYDNFVTSFCIPLLHSLAMGENLFNDSRNDNGQRKISYRYQAFPCIRVNRPGEFSIGPNCDMSYGHSMGNINFHIPLTPTYGTNALYTESHPGREDWHPLKTKAIGLGYSFDGARCIHYTLENTTMHSRVSLDFRIAIHREAIMQLPASVNPSNAKMMVEYSELMKKVLKEDKRCYDVHDVLCNKKMLEDNYSSFKGYYEEAYVELGTSSRSLASHSPGPVVCKKNGPRLMQPDKRVGFPF